MSELNKWDSFYVIIGSAAGAVIGLQFIVITLMAERPPVGAEEAGAAFASPTVVHFSAALFLSALLHVQWRTITIDVALWGVLGFIGVAYVIIIARRMWTQPAYEPVIEDWLFHAALPLAAYAGLAESSFAASSHDHAALLGVGGATLLLLFVGIHNPWDNIAYRVLTVRAGKHIPRRREETKSQSE